MSPDQNTNNAFEMVNTDIYINPSRKNACSQFQLMFDKKQTAVRDAANFLPATLGLFLQTVLCWSKAGSERVTKTELSTLNRLSAV